MFTLLTRRRLLALLVLTSILVVTIDRNGNPLIDRVRRGFAVVVAPFERASEAIARPVGNAWDGITKVDDLKRENAELKDQLERQYGAEIQYRVTALEHSALLELNRLTSAGNLKSETARVVGGAPSNFQNTIDIDKGSSVGIAVGMPVVSGAGLIGKISKVFPNRSIVLLITDPSYYMPAAVLTGVIPDLPTSETPTGGTTVNGLPIENISTTSTTSTTSTIAVAPSTTSTSVPVGGASSPTAGVTTTTAAPVELIRETGGVSGQGTGLPLLLRFVDDTVAFNEFKVKSTVKTAGGADSLSPPGIPIGEISKISKQTGNRSPLVEIKPYAKLNQLNFVAVVLYVPNPGAS